MSEDREMGTCSVCGNMHPPDDLHEVDGKVNVCNDCCECCNGCDDMHLLTNLQTCGHCGNYVCDGCHEHCNDCGTTLCPDCMYTCEECGYIYCPAHFGGGLEYCRHCSVQCDYCGDSLPRDDAYVCEHCEDTYLCNDCFHEYGGICAACRDEGYTSRRSSDTAGRIMNYSWRPDEWTQTKESHERICMGLELELNNAYANDAVAESKDLLNDGIGENRYVWKYDSSIGSGAELVTYPHSYSKLRKIDWRGILKKMRDTHGFRADEDGNCGVHIHIAEAAYRGIAKTKLEYFFSTNVLRILWLSGRSHSQMRAWCPMAYNRKDWNKISRSALNHTHKGTLEFRMFRGTTDHKRLRMYIDFVHTLTDYIKVHGITHCTKKESWDTFTEYAKEKGSKYLVKELSKIPKNINNKMMMHQPNHWVNKEVNRCA